MNVDWDVPPYHRINANFFVTGQHYYQRGNAWLLDLTLDQIYGATN